jgi:pilus assembly protein Flp/PilA
MHAPGGRVDGATPIKEDHMHRMCHRLLVDETGQDLVEYALLASLVALVSVTALSLLGQEIRKLFTHVSEVLPPA